MQFSGVVAVHQENEASDESDVLVKTRQDGQQKRILNFSGAKPKTPILDTINYPVHMMNLSVEVSLAMVVKLFFAFLG